VPKIIHIVENLDRGAVENWLVRMFKHGLASGNSLDWTFYCIFMESKIIAFYDSMNGKPKSGKGCDSLLKMLQELATIEKRNFDCKEWNCVQASCTKQVC
jgi:hypothetical protein